MKNERPMADGVAADRAVEASRQAEVLKTTDRRHVLGAIEEISSIRRSQKRKGLHSWWSRSMASA